MKTLEQILEICCNAFGTYPDEVKGKSKEPHIAAARQAYSFHAHQQTEYHVSRAKVMGLINRPGQSGAAISRDYKDKLTWKWFRPINDQIEYQIITN